MAWVYISLLTLSFCLIGRSSGKGVTSYGTDEPAVNLEPASTHARDHPSTRNFEFAGAVYTRWGRTECPDDAAFVYKGLIGGGNSAMTGAGSDYLCLPDSPEWGNYEPDFNQYSEMHGVNYQAGDKLFDKAKKVVGNQAVCAVCLSARSVQLMIPGKRKCTNGWTQEYYGYLMSAKYLAPTTRNWICVDDAPEVAMPVISASRGELWPVEVRTDTISNPKYVNNRELTCVVCSK